MPIVSRLRNQHNAYQTAVFDGRVHEFRDTIPGDVRARTEEIVAAAELSPADRVLDVGTGRGVLIPLFRRYGVTDIVACDLSPSMLEEAGALFPDVVYWCGDVIDLPADRGRFDCLFFNAMFGNVWDQRITLEKSVLRLTDTGRMIISHPMGSAFQRSLSIQNPDLVPHTLPDAQRINDLIAGLPLRVKLLRDETHLYLCVLDITCQRPPALHKAQKIP